MPDEYRTTPSIALSDPALPVAPLLQAGAPNMLTARLAPGCQLFIWSLRTWQRLLEDPQLPRDLLHTPYRYHDLPAALPLVEEMMLLLKLAGSRPIEIVKPYRRQLSDDEMNLVAALRLVDVDRQRAAQSLLGCMLPAPISRTFRRLLGKYAALLRARGLSTWAVARLHLVSGDAAAVNSTPATIGGKV